MTVNRFRFNSLRTIALVGVLVAAIVPVAVLTVTSALSVRNIIIEDTTSQSQRAAVALAEDIAGFLDDQAQIAAFVADRIAGQETPDRETVTPILDDLRENYPLAETVFVTNRLGRIIAISSSVVDDSSIGNDVTDRSYWQAATSTGQVALPQQLVIGRNSGNPIAIVAAPITGASGTPNGIVVMTTNANRISAMADRFAGDTANQVGVATATGLAVAHNDDSVTAAETDFSNTPIWNYLADGGSGVIDNYDDVNGVQRFAAFASVPNVDWRVWISHTRADVLSRVWATYLESGWFVLLAVAFAVVGIVLLVRLIVGPIESMRQVVSKIAAGDLHQRVDERGPAEVADLARAVNAMAGAQMRALDNEREVSAGLQHAVKKYSSLASRVASGDLSARAEVDEDGELGELGRGLNSMVASLEQLAEEVHEACNSIASATGEILAATSQQVSSAAEESSAVKETTATVHDVRQNAEVTARKTRVVADLANRAKETSEGGRSSVEESITSGQMVKQHMESLAERILAFSEQAQAIADINDTVADLAEQSNLLAVNAGIEAAKAGEAGQGFGVVANEVRALAERSREATAHVRRIVGEIQKSSQAAVIAAEQGVKTADSGSQTVQRSGLAINALANSVTEASQAAQQIIVTSEQQEIGMDQIVKAMQNIEQSSSQSVAATRQVERAAQDLDRLAKSLTNVVGTMKVGNGAARSAR
ncbi:MAG: methyl-accepting chemotaxis protein [Rhodospirillaceae bacterium]|nr:methyl-accepting chemotaxis protein [Rhodospirillaceae bacterium]